MKFENNKIICEGVVAESWGVPLKNFLESAAPNKIVIDLKDCRDMHTAIAQLLIAYAGVYDIDYEFSDKKYAYKLLLQGAKIA